MKAGLPFLRNMLVAALLYGLFAEWLRPLVEMADMTDVHRLVPFLGAVAFYMIIDAWGMRGAAAWPLKLAFTIGWIGYWFRPDAFADGSWWFAFPELFLEDVRALGAGQLLVSPETRTFVFLCGWAALVYAVYRIVADRGQALWFVGATLGFLVLLQLWPGLDTGAGVLRASAMGLLLLTVQQGTKWERLLGSRFAEGRAAALARIAVGALCAGAVLAAGYGLSAGKPSEPSPVPLERWAAWARAAAERGGLVEAAATTAAVGYGADDSRLGQAVTPNDEVAFIAYSERPTYWRGGSRDVYTGQGWRSSALDPTAATFRAGSAAAGEQAIEQRIDVRSPALERTLFAGGRVLRLPELTGPSGERVSDIHIRYDPEDDSYFVGTSSVRLASYRMTTALPAFDSAALLEDAAPAERDPSERYLQLPATLPARVRELARDIVADAPDHPYAKAQAIQAYLWEHYRYTLDTARPPDGADFVDDFLFEQKAGYCNHFSTAMVVLLRAVGVEARWVKGFAPGTPDPSSPNTYVVRQADAHAWVEVRFAKAGWVPFEATPAAAAEGVEAGFGGLDAMPANMLLPEGAKLTGRPAAALAAAASATPEAAAEHPASPAAALLASVQSGLRGAAAQAEAALDAAKSRLPHEWTPLLAHAVIGGAAAALAAYAAYGLARLLRRVRASAAPPAGDAPSRRASPSRRRLDRLWQRIYRRYGPRRPHETLRDYAARLPADSPEAREALLALVRLDEAVRYGGGGARVPSRWLEDVWRKIAK
ncbi:transglutaminase TgpA family protein [Paenibacillus sp.]|uniref:transglutaminase TgpA family protein n=1 Tax=Paenibacillus sp. TaxID=58172 RepID=UPI002D3EC3EA|nr:transglutaminase domain-containing protein [Paenibacillus sp.]HZG88324.1 transglutaminase domain-containing protein [Paenibacillus sp.]